MSSHLFIGNYHQKQSLTFTFSEFHFQTETKVDILTDVQRYKVNSVSNWMSPYVDCRMVIFLEKLKTTEAHEYAYNIT